MNNSIIENIKSRRSIRSFKDKPVPDQITEKIVEAGMFAPSALNMQPWKFIVIDKARLIEELSLAARSRIKIIYRLSPLLKIFRRSLRNKRSLNALKKTAESGRDTVFYNAPLLILIANDTRLGDTKGDCYLAAQNMMLAASSLGIGSCFIGRGNLIPKRFLLSKLNLPSYYDVSVHLAFGYPKDFPKMPPPRKKDIVKRI